MNRPLAWLCVTLITLWSGLTQAEALPGETIVYIGTQGDSVLSLRLDMVTGQLRDHRAAARIDRPTWVSVDRKNGLLFAVSEIGNYDGRRGQVHSLRIDPGDGKLTPVSTVDSGGGGPTYLSHDPHSHTLFAANFGSGDVAAFPVETDGRLGRTVMVQRQTGSGPLSKQKSAHPHATALDPSGRWLLVPDMGADRIFVYRFGPDRALSAAPTASVHTGPATGPRHIAFSRDGRFFYLVTEHSAEIRAFRWSPATGTLQQVQALALDPADAATRSAAEIAVSPDGRFLYASNRIRDRIQIFAISAKDGRLTPVQDAHSGGERPRSFGIDPSGRWLLVGNQDSQTVVAFAIDRRTGRIAQTGSPLAVPEKPVSFAFFPLTPEGK